MITPNSKQLITLLQSISIWFLNSAQASFLIDAPSNTGRMKAINNSKVYTSRAEASTLTRTNSSISDPERRDTSTSCTEQQRRRPKTNTTSDLICTLLQKSSAGETPKCDQTDHSSSFIRSSRYALVYLLYYVPMVCHATPDVAMVMIPVSAELLP